MEPFRLVQDDIMIITEWQKQFPNLKAGFTTKKNGYSKDAFETFNLGLHVNDNEKNVKQNRLKLAKNLGFSTSQWVCSEQVHDDYIKKVDREDKGKGVFNYKEGIPSTDGLYTDEPNLLLTSCYADCVPLLFMAPDKKFIGLAHAGWRGTVKGIANKMVTCWKDKEKISPESIFVAIGPAIRDCCYLVDDPVISEVVKILDPSFEKPFKKVSQGQYSLNLPLLNKQLLQMAGILETNILSSSLCTSCEDDLFFSHRRDKGKTGRMMSFIGYKED